MCALVREWLDNQYLRGPDGKNDLPDYNDVGAWPDHGELDFLDVDAIAELLRADNKSDASNGSSSFDSTSAPITYVPGTSCTPPASSATGNDISLATSFPGLFGAPLEPTVSAVPEAQGEPSSPELSSQPANNSGPSTSNKNSSSSSSNKDEAKTTSSFQGVFAVPSTFASFARSRASKKASRSSPGSSACTTSDSSWSRSPASVSKQEGTWKVTATSASKTPLSRSTSASSPQQGEDEGRGEAGGQGGRKVKAMLYDSHASPCKQGLQHTNTVFTTVTTPTILAPPTPFCPQLAFTASPLNAALPPPIAFTPAPFASPVITTHSSLCPAFTFTAPTYTPSAVGNPNASAMTPTSIFAQTLTFAPMPDKAIHASRSFRKPASSDTMLNGKRFSYPTPPAGWLGSESLFSARRAQRGLDEFKDQVQTLKSPRIRSAKSSGAAGEDVPMQKAKSWKTLLSSRSSSSSSSGRPETPTTRPSPYQHPPSYKQLKQVQQREKLQQEGEQHTSLQKQRKREQQEQLNLKRKLLKQKQQELNRMMQELDQEQHTLHKQEPNKNNQPRQKQPKQQQQHTQEDELQQDPHQQRKQKQHQHQDHESQDEHEEAMHAHDASPVQLNDKTLSQPPTHPQKEGKTTEDQNSKLTQPEGEISDTEDAQSSSGLLALSRSTSSLTSTVSRHDQELEGGDGLYHFDGYRMAPAQNDSSFDFFMAETTCNDARSDTEEDSNMDSLLHQFKSPSYQEPQQCMSDACGVSETGEGFDLMCDESSTQLTMEDNISRSRLTSVSGACEMSPCHSSVFVSQSSHSVSNSYSSVAATAGTHGDLTWPSVTDDESVSESYSSQKGEKRKTSPAPLQHHRAIPNYQAMTPWTSEHADIPQPFPPPNREIPCFPLDPRMLQNQGGKEQSGRAAITSKHATSCTAATETVYSLTTSSPSMSIQGQLREGSSGKRQHSSTSGGDTHMTREKRFRKTADALQKCGLWDIAMKTGELIKRNAELQKQIDRYRAEASVFLKTVVQNPENKELMESFTGGVPLTLTSKSVCASDGFELDIAIPTACNPRSKVSDGNSSTTSGYASYTEGGSKQSSPTRK